MIIARLLSDRHGAVAVEAALTLPIMMMTMFGILQFSLVLQASGAIRNSIGEGIRFAKVHPISDPSNPTEVATIKSEVEAVTRKALIGVNADGIKVLEFTTGTDSHGLNYGTISMTYELTLIIPFVAIPTIKLTQSRTSYLPT